MAENYRRSLSTKQMQEEALEGSQQPRRRHTSPLTDMSRSREDKEKILNPPPIDPVELVGDYPGGLCLCFDKEICEKLDLDCDEIYEGDTIDLRAFGTVTSCSNGRIEIQLTSMAVENENTEEVGEE